MKLNYLTLAVILIAALYFGWHASAVAWTPNQIAGVALGVPSLLLLVLARVQLGRAFSVQAKASILVTTGLYSRIRNPIYVFGSLIVASIIIFAAKWWLFVVLGALILMQVIRARKESRVLEAAFGEEYRAYKKRTWF